MRVTPRATAVVACAFAAVVFASACSSATTPTATLSTAPGTPATSAPATTPPVTTPPATTPPAEPAPPVFTTAEAAAKHLYAAWKAGDKTKALQGASQSAVDALFSEDWKDKTYFFGGCSDDTQCQYNWAEGAINMTISGNASSGFTVTAVDRGSAG